MRNLEPTVLAVALALLALVAAGLAYTLPTLDVLTGITSLEPNGHVPRLVKDDELAQRLTPWTTPTAWTEPESKSRLFKADGYFFYPSLYPAGNYIQRDDGTAVTPGGVLISWLQKYDLDITDPNIDREDPDHDGFSNKTEFFANSAPGTKPDGSKSTSPVNPTDHPTYLSRLRLQGADVHPFHIRFVGVAQLNGNNVYQIELTDVPASGQPPLKQTGDPLGYENWIVGPYTHNMVQETDSHTGLTQQVDRSTLELDKPDIGLKVVLPLAEIINAPDVTANFAMLMPSEVGKNIAVLQGKSFQLPLATPPETYTVISLDEKGAVIRNDKTKERSSIPRLDPNEWNDVPVPATAAASPTH